MSSPNPAQKYVQSPVTISANIIAPCVLARATETDGSSKGLQMGERLAHFQEEFDAPRGLSHVTIDKLTDNVLLEIFDVYLDIENPYGLRDADIWHPLVHVCRRWRDVMFASPRRLNLRRLCRRNRPVRAMLDSWPALPIVIEDDWIGASKEGLGNIIVALEHPDRVCSISLWYFPSSVGEALAAEMQVPFPELTHLVLLSEGLPTPVLPLPDSFLGGSAPRLQTLKLSHISFPALPNLLLSATDLVDIDISLTDLPQSGYISPEVMVTCLSSLNRLKSLQLRPPSPLSHPDQPSPPPRTRVVLPALSYLSLYGMIGYLEDFLARIDTPVLNQLDMAFFLVPVFDIPHLKQFIGRSKNLKPSKAATLMISPSRIVLEFDQPRGSMLKILISYESENWQDEVDSIALVCGQLSPFCSLIERLDFVSNLSPTELQGEDDIESTTQFLQVFRPFTATWSLHVCRSLVPFISTALQGLIGESATDVLPNLRNLFLGGSEIFGTVQEVIQPFVTARRLSGQPVAVRHWEGSTADR
ncbi:hypothetical protein BC826DRAFT_1107944 [Russula brevipes]|nr:hypothetical protein BC826DRAFT_1107944 [Russula brevipes]